MAHQGSSSFNVGGSTSKDADIANLFELTSNLNKTTQKINSLVWKILDETTPKFPLPPFQSFDGSGNYYLHLQNFIRDLYDQTYWDSIVRHLFEKTLSGEAENWLRRLHPAQVTSWDNLQKRFLEAGNAGFFSSISKGKEVQIDTRNPTVYPYAKHKKVKIGNPSFGFERSVPYFTAFQGTNFMEFDPVSNSILPIIPKPPPTQKRDHFSLDLNIGPPSPKKD